MTDEELDQLLKYYDDWIINVSSLSPPKFEMRRIRYYYSETYVDFNDIMYIPKFVKEQKFKNKLENLINEEKD